MERIICLLLVLSLIGCATPKKQSPERDIWKQFEETLERMDDGNSR